MRPCPSWQLTVPIGDDGSSTPIMVAWGDEWGLVSLSDCLRLSDLCPACLPSRAGRLTRGGQVLIKTLQGFLMTRKSPIRRPLRRKDITSGTLQETRIAVIDAEYARKKAGLQRKRTESRTHSRRTSKVRSLCMHKQVSKLMCMMLVVNSYVFYRMQNMCVHKHHSSSSSCTYAANIRKFWKPLFKAQPPLSEAEKL